ncbi:MAG: type II CRISPR-associated endonuclease Cas1 [Candidatus Micrarchaeaceae archaeon]
MHHNSHLTVDRGCLVCSVPEIEEHRIPLTDILAVIIAARGISFSSECISRLTENGTVILHCNESYHPIAKTIRLYATIHNEIFEKQISKDTEFNQKLWNKLLYAKIKNQALLLDIIKPSHKLWNEISTNSYDEGNIARYYWKIYFSFFKDLGPPLREHKDAIYPVNQRLNYGYAVLSAILHRSLVGHGLITSLGIHHKYRFKSDPLLYDIMEPLRPLCEAMLASFFQKYPDIKMDEWAKTVAQGLIEHKIIISNGKTTKLIYAIDIYVRSISECFFSNNLDKVYIPEFWGTL